MTAARELIEFWDKADLAGPPYRHPDDDLPASSVQQGVACYADWVRAFNEGRLSPSALHLSLLPVPYAGDLENAELIILLLNPGFAALDYVIEASDPEYRRAIVETIRQVRRPHMFLDPKWAWAGGFVWWEGKLRGVCRMIADAKFNKNYAGALADLARRIAVLQLVPYHSTSFAGPTDLASADAAKRFAREAAKDRTVVAARKVREWALEEGPNVVTYGAGLARGASLGPQTPGGRAILALYGIS